MSFWLWIASLFTLVTIVIAVRQLNAGGAEMPPSEDDG
jgi:hypothetical protein